MRIPTFDLRLTHSFRDCVRDFLTGYSARNSEGSKVSISLIIHRKAGSPAHSSSPLSTEDVFKKVWLRGAENIDAQWIPLFQSGIDLEEFDIPAVCDELVALKRWIETTLTDASRKSAITKRIDAALKNLQTVLNEASGDARVFIG